MMKKTLIALALAATTVSGSAMAWTEGDFNGSIDIGGAIKPLVVTWKWQASPAISDEDINVKDAVMNKDRYDFSGILKQDKTLLKGVTTALSPVAKAGMSPVINFTVKAESGTTGNNKHFVLPVMDENAKEIGSFSFSIRLYALALGDTLQGRNYLGIADPGQSYGNGYFKYKADYDAIGHEGFKNGIVAALGADAPDFAGATASTGGIWGVSTFSVVNTTDPITNWAGAYAAVAQAGTGKLNLNSVNSNTWKASLPVTVSYQ